MVLIGVALLAYGVFMYKQTKNGAAWDAFTDGKSGIMWDLLFLKPIAKGDRSKLNNFAQIAILAGGAALITAYYQYNKLQAAAIVAKSKSFFF